SSLHAYRHILDRVALALMGKLESAIETDPKANVIKAGPGIVLRSEQHRGFHFLAVANTKRLSRWTRHVLLDVFEVNIDGRVPTGTMPILEDVSVAVDDHFGHESDARERQFATERPTGRAGYKAQTPWQGFWSLPARGDNINLSKRPRWHR